MTDVKQSFDSATLEVLWTRLVSIVDEAAAALVRTSFSTVVRDSHDFSCVITDVTGGSLVQATDSIPSFIGTLPRTIRHFLNEYPAETLQPGDVPRTVADTTRARDLLGYAPDTPIEQGIERFVAWYRAQNNI